MTNFRKTVLKSFIYIAFLCSASIFTEASDVNLLENPGAEKQIKANDYKKEIKLSNSTNLSENVPENWGVFNTRSTVVEWGSSDKEFHSGKYSCFLKLAKNNTPEKKILADILLGNTNGHEGNNAIPAEANTEYLFSFWIKGNASKVEARGFLWKGASSEKERTCISTSQPDINVTPEWKQFSGVFKTVKDTKKMALGIRLAEAEPGQYIFVDDAVIKMKPEISAEIEKHHGKLRVAVYDSGNLEKTGMNYTYKALQENKNIELNKIDTLKSDIIKKYDVLLISTTRELSRKDAGSADLGIPPINHISSLLNFVDAGGGLILGHDALGYRGDFGKVHMFPKTCVGIDRSENNEVVVSETPHPITSGISRKFTHSYFDHITIQVGDKSVVLAKDGNGKPVITASELSRGRIVGIGYPMGLCHDNGKDTPCELTADEKGILLNAVKWAGANPKFNIPMEITNSTLLPEVEKYAKAKEELALEKYKDLPAPGKFDEATMWLFSYSLYTEEQIVKIIDNCQKMGFNKILVLAKAGAFFYKSKLYPEETSQKPEKFIDVVEIVARETHKRNMKLGLIIYPFVSHPAVYKQLPVSITAEERAKLDKGATIDEIITAKTKKKWSCQDHPDSQAKAFNIAKETIEKYHPDEIHFDYVRYITGYEYPCCCDYSLAQKAEFSRKHPEISKKELDAAFAKSQLVDFYTRLHEFCKKVDPNVKTSCYTISPGAPKWAFLYPFNYHTKYVSRFIDAYWTLDRIEKDTQKYYEWMKELNPKGIFVPMLSSYDFKSGNRIYDEIKILSWTLDKLKIKPRNFIYYSYDYLEDPQTGKLYEDVARGFSRALNGTWR